MKKLLLISAIIFLCLAISYPSFASTSLPQEATSKICVGFYIDKNRNGFRDTTEIMGDGYWFFESLKLSGGRITNRNFECIDLPPDEYTINVNLNYLALVYPQYSLTTQSEIKVTLLPTSRLVIEFGLSPTELCITTFRDENKNGARDEGEKFVEGIDLAVLGTDRKSILAQNKTNSQPYCILVEPGNYQIEVTVPPDYIATTQTIWNKSITVDTTENVEFGIAPKNEAVPAFIQAPKTQICVLVYSDLNGNGNKEEDEGLVKGASVEILDSSGKRVAEFITNGFSEPNCTTVDAGNHLTQVKAPQGYRATTRLDWTLDVPKEKVWEAELEFGVQPTNSQSIPKNTFTRENILPFLLSVFFVGITFMLGYMFKSRVTSTSNSLRKKWGIANIILIFFTFVAMLAIGVFADLHTESQGIVASVAGGVIIICAVSELLVSIYDRYRAHYSRIKKVLGISNLVVFIFIITVMPLLWGLGYVRANATADVSLGVGAGCILFEIGWAIHNKFFKDKINKPPQSWL